MAGIQTRLSSQLQQQFALRVEISAEEKRLFEVNRDGVLVRLLDVFS
jgi:hypothetical protein